MPDKHKVKTLLDNLPVLSDAPSDNKGNLDVKAYNKTKEVKWVIRKLKEENVDGAWLRGNGFLIAAMILDI
jgi:hypothetical protein